MNRTRAALFALAGLLLTLLPTLSSPAAAAQDTTWSAQGPGNVVTVSSGAVTAAAMTYDYDPTGLPVENGSGVSGSWLFTATAGLGGDVTVPWSWKGLHAWAGVTARLEMVVDGVVVGTLVDAGPQSCCTTPSNGFVYGGTAKFTNLVVGQRYGFRLSGSNGDRNDFLQGSLTLSTRPYLEALGGEDDNRQWTGASELADTPSDPADSKLMEPGEARWWKVKVVPGQRLQVDLAGLTRDYDLALYGDIGASFAQLIGEPDLAGLAAGAGSSAAGNGGDVPDFPAQVAQVPSGPAEVGPAFAPRVYAPRVYAPRVYAPRVYAPRVYAPRVYAPRVYASDAYDRDIASNPGFRDAFAAAQNLTLLAVSTESRTTGERVIARTGDSTGYFYVRVQAHDDTSFDTQTPFSLTRSFTGNEACAAVQSFATTPTSAPTTRTAQSVVVTDTDVLFPKEGQVGKGAYLDALNRLATATGGAVVDLAESPRVDALRAQVKGMQDCSYAADLIAGAARDIVNSYRNDALRYVVLAGGDDVVPFFRYPDRSGLGEEKQFELGDVLVESPAKAALADNQVLSQDAYGSVTDLTIAGGSLSVPDLAVGRLVKTPAEIQSTVARFLEPGGDALPVPDSSLVTGYDFLSDAATEMGKQFAGALGGTAPGSEELITPAGVPTEQGWDNEALFAALTGKHHDLLFLAGHFSANDTLAADFATTLSTDELARGALDPTDGSDPVVPDAPPSYFADSLVISPGCHSGYGIDEVAAGTRANSYDWTQYMAQQHAVLVAGTGYQYGDTDFLAYSERLYLQFAERLRVGTGPVSLGEALVAAKRDYLAGLGTLTGIDQKAVQQATLYGLPMTTIAVAGRLGPSSSESQVSPAPVGSGTPGAALGLRSATLDVETPLTERHKDSHAEAFDLPAQLTWFEGRDGVSAPPGAPVVPQHVVDVSADTLLRGVGFRSGTYRETSGLLPLTGAPAIEGTTPHSTFFSPAWFPQQLTNVNYFDALGTRGSSGRTSLVLSPAQWRSDDVDEARYEATQGRGATNEVRTFSRMGVELFYSGLQVQTTPGNQPALAAAPGISQVQAYGDDASARISVRVTGDPSAGVHKAWVTWTTGPGDTGSGTWQSLDLVQDPVDSTLWTVEVPLPPGVREQVRFLVQAVNGAGAVSLDTDDGNGYRVEPEPDAIGAHLDEAFTSTAVPTPRDLGMGTKVLASDGSGAAGYSVRFQVVQDGLLRSSVVGTSDSNGDVPVALAPGTVLRPGPAEVSAALLRQGTDDDVLDTVVESVTVQPDRLTLTSTWLTTDPFQAYATSPVRAVLRDARDAPLAGVPVTFTTPTTGPTATFSGPFGAQDDAHHLVRWTDATGAAEFSTSLLRAGPLGGTYAVTGSSPGSWDAASPNPLSVNLDMGPFVSPVLNKSGSTTAKVNSTTPVKIAALNAGGRPVSDATGAQMQVRRQVVVRWRLKGSADWNAPIYSAYVPDKDFFQADLKSSSFKWAAGRTYTVTVSIYPWWNDLPAPFTLEQKSFDISIVK